MRQWSSFFHLFLRAEQRLRAVVDSAEGTVTLWIDQEPIVTIHTDGPDYCRELASAINVAKMPPLPEPGAPTMQLVKK